jgi:hypothetical protein
VPFDLGAVTFDLTTIPGGDGDIADLVKVPGDDLVVSNVYRVLV